MEQKLKRYEKWTDDEVQALRASEEDISGSTESDSPVLRIEDKLVELKTKWRIMREP